MRALAVDGKEIGIVTILCGVAASNHKSAATGFAAGGININFRAFVVHGQIVAGLAIFGGIASGYNKTTTAGLTLATINKHLRAIAVDGKEIGIVTILCGVAASNHKSAATGFAAGGININVSTFGINCKKVVASILGGIATCNHKATATGFRILVNIHVNAIRIDSENHIPVFVLHGEQRFVGGGCILFYIEFLNRNLIGGNPRCTIVHKGLPCFA